MLLGPLLVQEAVTLQPPCEAGVDPVFERAELCRTRRSIFAELDRAVLAVCVAAIEHQHMEVRIGGQRLGTPSPDLAALGPGARTFGQTTSKLAVCLGG
jgi:hypothetical protein